MQLSRIDYKEAWADERLDAEFFQPEFLRNAHLVDKKNKIFQFVENKTPAIDRENIGIFNYLEIANISTSSLEHHSTQLDPSVEPIPTRATYSLKKDDVLVSTVRPNRNAIAFISDEKNLVATNGCVVLRAKGIEPEYLFAFCKTEYFIKHQMRANKASMYPAVSSQDIFNTPIFLPSNEFKELIVIKIKKSLSYHKKFKEEFFLANQILTEELNFSISKPDNPVSFFLKNYSTIQSTRRMDADYFQPKYEQMIKTIKNYRGGWDFLENLTAINNQNFIPKKNKVYKYLELANISISGNILGYTEETGENLPTRARRKVLTNDVIVSSVEGSLESVALIPEEYNNSLCSTGFHVLRSSTFSPECLFVFMKSILGQSLLKKGCRGTILPAIGEDEISQLPLPLLEDGLQKKINNKVSQAALAHQHSKNLLQTAKRAVEIAIEKGETKAKAWLEKQE